MTKQQLLAHDPQHALVVDVPASALERLRHSTIAGAGKLQDEFFNGSAQGHLRALASQIRSPGLTRIALGSIHFKQRRHPLNGNGQARLACVGHDRMPLL